MIWQLLGKHKVWDLLTAEHKQSLQAQGWPDLHSR